MSKKNPLKLIGDLKIKKGDITKADGITPAELNDALKLKLAIDAVKAIVLDEENKHYFESGSNKIGDQIIFEFNFMEE